MDVSVVRGGGIAGLVTRTRVTTDDLPAERAQALRQKVVQSGLLSAADAPAVLHPDEQRYEITVVDEGAAHTVRATETSLPEPLRELVRWLDALPEREESIEPPGGGPPL